MIRAIFSIYFPSYPRVLVYMLQSTEYQPIPYIKWVWRSKDFTQVMQRRTLESTKAARLLLITARLGMLAEVIIGLVLVILGTNGSVFGGQVIGGILILVYPVVWAHLLVVPLLLGKWFVTDPAEQKLIADAEHIYASHPGVIIAVAGSYGKTTMKELLLTILSEGLKVAATPANKNVASSHAAFAASLNGDEDVLIIEYGEGAPGDVAKFAKMTHPSIAIITGLAPAHLDQYKTLQAAGEDIFSIAEFVGASNVYVNSDSPEVSSFISKKHQVFNRAAALGWKTSRVQSSIEGSSFTIKKGSQQLELHSGLVGEHHVGFLAFVTALAVDMGLTKAEVKAGIAKTKPFEHRMQPYQLGGAWIVDDTYNGNLEGIRAGTSLLKSVPGERKIYVTPGLVDQGDQKEPVHIEVGKLIAAANPTMVVLMQNSVTSFIQKGLSLGGYKGQIQIESNPLEFYTNLKHFVAHGDVVVMQNDWTDNYA